MGSFSADIVHMHPCSSELPCSFTVSDAVAVIDHAVISMAAGETRVLHIHVTQTGDEDIDRLFELASALHTNFYEDWYGAGRAVRGLRDIETLLDNPEPSVSKAGSSWAWASANWPSLSSRSQSVKPGLERSPPCGSWGRDAIRPRALREGHRRARSIPAPASTGVAGRASA